MIKILFVILTTSFALSCLDQISQEPPCFLDGMEENERSAEISVNICCDNGSDGDTFCRGLFTSEGYGTISQLGRCSDEGYCKLCEIGVDCSCLSNRDCETDKSCTITDETAQCSEQLNSSITAQRCAICL
jgi:hypothetical protein